ncbi:MAG: hypothetical protein OHK0029_18320 [Armatimonadaceae bacterium]
MNKLRTGALVAAGVLGGFILGQAAPASAQLGGILKGGAIAILVDKFSGDIDRFVNKITGNRTTAPGESTRVVPILSGGQGTFVGAVQVSGPKDQVDKVKAVAQLEGKARLGGDIRARVLIPVSTRDVKDTGAINRVKGVGVSALIDVKL